MIAAEQFVLAVERNRDAESVSVTVVGEDDFGVDIFCEFEGARPGVEAFGVGGVEAGEITGRRLFFFDDADFFESGLFE